MTSPFLGSDWMSAVQAAADSDDSLAATLGDARLSVLMIVRDGPDGDIEWNFSIADGRVAFGLGSIPDPDITVRQSYATAASIARGGLDPQQAFMTGQVIIEGDMGKALRYMDQYRAATQIAGSVAID